MTEPCIARAICVGVSLCSYPDATIEELEAVNNVCIICREEMVSRCKKLPCSHIFHTACLQSWFQRQQTCPTCRMDVLNRAVINRLTQAQQGQAQQPAQPQNPRPPQGRFGGKVEWGGWVGSNWNTWYDFFFFL